MLFPTILIVASHAVAAAGPTHSRLYLSVHANTQQQYLAPLPQPTMHHLTLRGGATNDEKAITFALTNIVVYAVLYKGMTSFGGIKFITVVCWVVWVMWLACSNLLKDIVDEVLLHPQETIVALASSLLNMSSANTTATSSSKEDTFLRDDDVKEMHVERGARFLFPSELLVDCDNGLDWNGLTETVQLTQLLADRSELVTLKLADEKTYMRRKQLRRDGNKGREAATLMFREVDYKIKTARRGEPFTFPSHLILARCDNGLGDNALGDDGLDGVTSYSQLKQRNETVTLRFVSEETFCERWEQFQEGSRSDSPLLNASAAVFRKLGALMEGGFLAPAAWHKLRARPVALFGSVFSHQGFEHISGNLMTLRMCHEAEAWLGTARFAHLYLTSALFSQGFCCIWHKHAPRAIRKAWRGQARQSLGASGAISGVMAWWCLECFKRGHSFQISGRSVSPLLFWMLYVAVDLSGMLRLGAVQKLMETTLEQMVSNEEKAKTKDGRADVAKPEVGYDAHLGGAIAGLLWHLPTLFVRRR